jgi:hypothetical protein
MSIEEEFPRVLTYVEPADYTRFRARAVEMERAQADFREFMANEAARIEECVAGCVGESVATPKEIFAYWAECCRDYAAKLPPAPDLH